MVTDDDAFNMVKRLAAEEGLLGGSSAGATVSRFASNSRANSARASES